MAESCNHIDCIKKFLEFFPSDKERQEIVWSPNKVSLLHEAVSRCHVDNIWFYFVMLRQSKEKLKKIILWIMKPTGSTKNRDFLIFEVVTKENTQLLALLFYFITPGKREIFARDVNLNLLHKAASNGHLETLKYLLQQLSKDDQKRALATWLTDGKTLLETAKSKGHNEMVSYMEGLLKSPQQDEVQTKVFKH